MFASLLQWRWPVSILMALIAASGVLLVLRYRRDMPLVGVTFGPLVCVVAGFARSFEPIKLG